MRHGAVAARILLWPPRDGDHGEELSHGQQRRKIPLQRFAACPLSQTTCVEKWHAGGAAAGVVPPILEHAREKELLRIWKCVDPRDRLAARRYLRALIVARNT
jgi:hypothetical protein